MYEHNGVGLAGPQIVIAKRIFVALETKKDDASNDDRPPPVSTDEKRERWGVIAEHVFINPVISHFEGKAYDTEGCLSIPGLYVEDVERYFALRISYQTLDGEAKSLNAQGHFARVIQHEVDHLDGILFLDRLNNEDKRSFMNEHRKDLAEMQREAKAFLRDNQNQLQVAKIS